eukprot:TRINITY_DN4642_c0_g1_i2.p1 TRINITY_DN4642_c0_g1~~TRINITY_DN4642_c0_g1_i2.p1  ORF type:complete len:154 (-),score=23.39 TRINITY_DN4642_c0_g1_i2:81-521(-)
MDSKGEEYEIPRTVVNRIIKASLPTEDNVQIAKDAKLALTKSARIFVQFLAACANDICTNEHKTKITTEHIIQAIEEMEFDFAPKLQEFLDSYKNDGTSAKKKPKSTKTPSSGASSKEAEKPAEETADKDKEGEPQKKRKLNPGDE